MVVSGTAAAMAQVNVRVDRQVKERAEETLRLSGTSLSRVIKKLIDAVAQGGDRCAGVLESIEPVEEAHTAAESPFASSWAAVEELYRDLEISSSPGSDVRDWDSIYSEAMDERYREKGLYS